MARWARCASFQNSGFSDSLFSSARRCCATSTSKMPPQQPHRLLDFFDQIDRFRAHVCPEAAIRGNS
jgi:hypothetical protein